MPLVTKEYDRKKVMLPVSTSQLLNGAMET